MRPPRWGHIASAIAVLGLLVAPALPGAAGSRVLAHSQLVASSPAAGTTLPQSPPEIRLVFSEPLEAQVTSLDVVAGGTAVLSRAGVIDPADPYALVVDDPELPDGVYMLTWRTLSAADGHTAQGFFTFAVGEQRVLPQVADGGMTHTDADPLTVIGRWLTYIGLLLALGLAIFHRVVIREGAMPRPLVQLLAAGLALSAVATAAMAIVAGLETPSVVEYMTGTRNGALQLARGAVAAIGAAALVVVPARVAGVAAGGAALVGILLLVVAGHAAALPGFAPILGQVVHIVAAGIWIGGLTGLLLLTFRPRLLTTEAPPGMRTYVPRFSALALVSIGLVGLTGVYSAWLQTGALVTFETEYGRTLILKSVLAAAAIGLGGLNYLDGGRMIARLAGFKPRLMFEVTAAAAVLVVTAVLATTPPTEEVNGVAIEPIPDAFGEVAPRMGMEVAPGRPGLNRVAVSTSEAMGGVNLELALDRLDDGSTTRVPLTHEGMIGMEGMDHTEMDMGSSDGTIDWFADSIVLPAGSEWDTSVRILLTDGTEVSRQRFAFTVTDTGIDEGRVSTLLEPPVAIALLLVLGGALGLGLGLGGMSLPRCEAAASRLALLGGGATAVVLGALIGASRLFG
jgi:copper transport protein